MKLETKLMAVYVLVGILAGYFSHYVRLLYGESGNYIAISLAIIILVVVTEISKKVFKLDKKFSWFLSNGGWLFLFVWFISWIIFYNIFTPGLGA
jgi:hypothetical protein